MTPLTDAETNALLERFDASPFTEQRRIVVEMLSRLVHLEASVNRLCGTCGLQASKLVKKHEALEAIEQHCARLQSQVTELQRTLGKLVEP